MASYMGMRSFIHCRLPLSTRRPNGLPSHTLKSPFSTHGPNNAQIPRFKGLKTVLLVTAGGLAVCIPSVYFNIRYLDHPEDESQTMFADAIGGLSKIEWPELGISRIDIGNCNSNSPGEDRIATMSSKDPKLGFVAIYDGHNGGELAEVLRKALVPMVSLAINKLYQDSESFQISNANNPVDVLTQKNNYISPRPSPEAIDNAIKQIFINMDNEIVHQAAQKVLGLDGESYRKLNTQKEDPHSTPPPIPSSRTSTRLDAAKALKLANAGSCAVLGIFDAEDRSLRVALTGDLRVVFGRRVRDTRGEESGEEPRRYVYEAEALTVDQNATNSVEAARLSVEHPDEEDLLKNNRVLGWGPSRAFGDGVMKWSREVRKRLNKDYLGDRPRDNYKTPPYFTAEPVITTKNGIQKGDFVVFASDGLWDCLGSEEVVGLVGQWLENNGTKERLQPSGSREVTEVVVPPTHTPENPGLLTLNAKTPHHDEKTYTPSDLPVMYPVDSVDSTVMYRYWRAEKKFVCHDKDSVALHLIRNALGGADKDLRDALLELRPPRSRRFRDDISVIVVFFG